MTASAPRRASGWLFGPVPDLLLGCGTFYLVFFAGQALWPGAMRQWLPADLGALLTLMISGPHYGATLLRVYERREDRRRYAFFAVWLTAILAGLFVMGLHSLALGSWLITIYLTWSPWHYTGQNYGIALMFLGRRGVAVSPLCKRLIHTSFIASYALVFLTLHGVDPGATYAPGSYDGTVYRFLPLGMPPALAAVLLLGGGALYLGSTLAAGALLLRSASLRAIFPAVLLAGTQALWFAVPALARMLGVFSGIEPFSQRETAYTFMWIAVGHAIQYLWITSYYARRAGGSRGHAHFLGKALLAGAAIWTVPLFVFAPGALGTLPAGLGLGVLAAAVVNLHHFVLDGAIWKLRDGRIAKVLVRSGDEARPEAIGPPRAPALLRGAGWITGCMVLALAIFVRVEDRAFGRALERGDAARMQSAVASLSRLGADHPVQYALLADAALGRGDLDEAEAWLDRSLELHPTPAAWMRRGLVHDHLEQWSEALESYGRALALDPDHVRSLSLTGRAWLQLGRPDRALEPLERALALHPEHEITRKRLAAAKRMLARRADARG